MSVDLFSSFNTLLCCCFSPHAENLNAQFYEFTLFSYPIFAGCTFCTTCYQRHDLFM